MDRSEAALRIAEQALSEARGALRAIASLTRDEGGSLFFVAPDGEIINLGSIQGKPGEKGEPGAPGKDGRDGFGFDDMTEELAEDGRTIIRRYTRGEEIREFRHTFAVLLDKGVFREGETYTKGDAVTWGGSIFIAQETTSEKPETSKAWRLAVKRGRDGKDGKDGQLKGPPPPVKIGSGK